MLRGKPKELRAVALYAWQWLNAAEPGIDRDHSAINLAGIRVSNGMTSRLDDLDRNGSLSISA